MKSRKTYQGSYKIEKITNSKIPFSTKEETFLSKFDSSRIKKYTKRDVDMIKKIQRWWKIVLFRFTLNKRNEKGYSKRTRETFKQRYNSSNSIKEKRINKYDSSTNNYKNLCNSLNSTFNTNVNSYSNNTNNTNIIYSKNQDSKSYSNYNTNSFRGSITNYIQIQSNHSNHNIPGSLSTSPSVKSKYLIETKKVEIFRKPKQFSSENKTVSKYSKNSIMSFGEISKKEVKNMMSDIWKEESFCSTVESLSIISDENKSNSLSQNNIVFEEYEEEINKLRNLVIEKNKGWNEINIPSPVNEIYIESLQSKYNKESISDSSGILEIQEMNALSIISNKKRYTNICQHLTSLTIFSQGKEEENVPLIFQKIEEINITSIIPEQKNKNKIQELDGLEIINVEKNGYKNIIQKMDKIYIKSYKKNYQENKIIVQELDGLEILKSEKLPYIPQCVDELLIPREYDMLLVKPKYNTILQIQGSGLNLLSTRKNIIELENQELDEFIIPGKKNKKKELMIQSQEKIIFDISLPENMITKMERFSLKGEINKALLNMNIEKIENFEIKEKNENKISEKIEWNKIIKPIKTTKVLIKNKDSNEKIPKKIITKEETETIERVYINNKKWDKEITKPIKTTKLIIKGIKFQVIWNNLNIEKKDKINLSSKEKEELITESFAFNLEHNNKKFRESLHIENIEFNLEGNKNKEKENILLPIQNERIFIKNKAIEEKIKIVEKIVEKRINWNQFNIPEKISYLNIIPPKKEKKVIILKKQRHNSINIIGNDLPKQQPKKTWNNLLRAQKSTKLFLECKPKLKLYITNGDKLFIQKESEEEIIYNDDYNTRNQKEKEEKLNEQIKTQIIKEKEIIPRYQREIKAQIARVKEISESDSSSLSELDVLEGIKLKNTNKEIINVPNGYQAKKINGEIIYTSKNGLGINIGGALYQKEENKFEYNKKFLTINKDNEKSEKLQKIEASKKETLQNNVDDKIQKIPIGENKIKDEIKKGQIIFNPKLKSHYSTSSANISGNGKIIINSRKIYEKKIRNNNGDDINKRDSKERKSNIEIKMRKSKIKGYELLRDYDSQKSF